MALTDTTEYWWDVKNHFENKRPAFTHIKGYDCGHFHVHETKKLTQVDCYACLKHIENTPELKQRLEQSKQSKEQYKFRFGKCECGSPMCERKNKSTGEIFLGCTQYPKCKHTRAVISRFSSQIFK